MSMKSSWSVAMRSLRSTRVYTAVRPVTRTATGSATERRFSLRPPGPVMRSYPTAGNHPSWMENT